ncbi:glycosyltransferase family 4 protein [Caldisalinibacter kiritimatiensis]|uniref:Glycosyl transferase, group 1 family n=1 Tax=Caldisalinibacter kiritimatiensis TaxID=1304284 RepID=R1CB94_9FIRM|nr:glycosyltransferase family 1 protein [Caldisalinibacter kiritimatiensis]EOC99579.1 glycosyl transferase, group 1 family [Caldisalinibacter kiritimatiensis]
MKVAIFTDTFLPQINGVTKTLGKYIEYMEENDIDYRVFAPIDGDKEYNDRIIRFFSVKFFLYPECRMALPNYFTITKELDSFKPDIVHIVTPFNIGLFGYKYAKDNNIPIVSSYHTNIPQYLEYFNLGILKNVAWNFFRWFHSNCKKNYCPSQSTLELLKSQGIKDLEIWGRGIDTNKFSPKYRDTELRKLLNIDEKLVFLYVGRISSEKDLDVFMETTKKINENYKEKVHFLMVGDGPILEELKEEAPDNMTFTGFKQGEELSKYFASSDVFMFPSSTETYGNVILEAMASGLPVIACYEGGIKENLIDGYNGVACGAKKVEDYYEAAVKMIEDTKFRNNIASNALKYTAEKSWRSVFNRLFNSFKEVLDTEKSNQINKMSA